MTKFITYYNLFPIPDPKEFLGTVADCEDGHVITTLSRNIVIVLNIRTQKQVRSWSMVEKLSSKVVYDRSTEKYVGVFGQNTLRCWEQTTVDINKCKKLKFQRSIAELLCDSAGKAILLYADGTAEPLTIALQTRKELAELPEDNELAPAYSLSDANILRLNASEQLLCYFKHCHRSGALSLICQCLTLEGLPTAAAANEYKISIGNTSLKCMGYTVVDTSTVPMLMTIWSDKRIFMLSLTPKTSADESPGTYVALLSELDVSNALSMHCISRNFVAIYGAKSGQDGGMLLLYNTQFKVVKAKQYFKIYFALSRLWSLDEHILLAMGQNLSVVSYRMSKELLSELIGTKRSNNFSTLIDEDYINEEEAFEDCISYAGELIPSALERTKRPTAAPAMPQTPASKTKGKKTKANIKADDSTQQQLSKHIVADGKFVPFMPADSFNKELNALAHKLLHVELVLGSAEALDEDNIALEVLGNLNEPGCRQLQLQQLMLQMERCGASEHELSEKLLTVFMRLQRDEDMLMCLQRYTNISEKMLAKTLRYALKRYQNAGTMLSECVPEAMELDADCMTPHAKQNKKKKNGLSTAEKQEVPNYDILAQADASATATSSSYPLPLRLLNAVLSCSYSADCMSVHIRRELSYEQVLLLLEHLHAMLVSPTITRFSARPVFTPNCMEFELQLFRWFGTILNSHFQQLVMSKDMQLIDLLYKWSELLLLYQQQANELAETCAMLYDIVHQRKVSVQKNYAKWYSIEEVDLF